MELWANTKASPLHLFLTFVFLDLEAADWKEIGYTSTSCKQVSEYQILLFNFICFSQKKVFFLFKFSHSYMFISILGLEAADWKEIVYNPTSCKLVAEYQMPLLPILIMQIFLTLFNPGFLVLNLLGGADLPPPTNNGGNGREVPKLSWNLISYRD